MTLVALTILLANCKCSSMRDYKLVGSLQTSFCAQVLECLRVHNFEVFLVRLAGCSNAGQLTGLLLQSAVYAF